MNAFVVTAAALTLAAAAGTTLEGATITITIDAAGGVHLVPNGMTIIPNERVDFVFNNAYPSGRDVQLCAVQTDGEGTITVAAPWHDCASSGSAAAGTTFPLKPGATDSTRCKMSYPWFRTNHYRLYAVHDAPGTPLTCPPVGVQPDDKLGLQQGDGDKVIIRVSELALEVQP